MNEIGSLLSLDSEEKTEISTDAQAQHPAREPDTEDVSARKRHSDRIDALHLLQFLEDEMERSRKLPRMSE